jgi:signal peptidase I
VNRRFFVSSNHRRLVVYSVGALCFLCVIAGGRASVFSVASGSMEPALKTGDLVVIDRVDWFLHERGWAPGALQHGDVIVFRSVRDSSRVMLKRVIGLPGESVVISRGTVFINGVALTEPYVQHSAIFDPERDRWPRGPGGGGAVGVIIPREHYFVLGDNRDGSIDSRQWGSGADE